ncbi:MAG: T9SS type A sorting domain-containing protein [Candidatus Azobacteroides sp.]|nr:T9SS type A sorting domain-containing protein [Candidatus Azobacteroides sp.]
MKKIIYLFSLLSVLSASAANPPFSQTDINNLIQQQKTIFGSQVFSATTMKGVLMHANTTQLYSELYLPYEYTFGQAFGPHSVSQSTQLMKDAYNSNNVFIQEITLNSGESLSYIMPKYNAGAIKASIIWDNPGGDIEFGSAADRNIKLQDDIDLRIYKRLPEEPYQPYYFTNRYLSVDVTQQDNSVDNFEQVFVEGEFPLGVTVQDAIYRSWGTAIVEISHKGTLANGSKTVSVVVTGLEIYEDNIMNLNVRNGEYFARNNITSSYSHSDDAILVAGNAIILNPGFSVTSSVDSRFIAQANPLLKRKFPFSANSIRSAGPPEEEGTTGINGISLSEVSLSQNTPNPFRKVTVIGYSIPQEIGTALISVCDLQGRTVKTIPIEENGQGEVYIDASDLKSGIYLYSLIIDGVKVETRRMCIK